MQAPSIISDWKKDQPVCADPETVTGFSPKLSIGIFAWNEEAVIGCTLTSLFAQTLFEEFSKCGWRCEVVCVINGCSDATPQIAKRIFSEKADSHPFSESFKARVVEIDAAGKLNAWNEFVHSISARSASYLIMMDADISLHRSDTVWRLVQELESDAVASVSVDRPRKHLAFKRRRFPTDWLSLAMSKLTGAAAAQLCGQLYCIRAEIARNIYLPKDLGACEDGFIKALVCSDFVSRPIAAARIKLAAEAEHTFEAYTDPRAIFRNQKRQMIGQTIVHILIDQFLPGLSSLNRLALAEFLQKKDETEPDWLKLLVRDHLSRTKVWWRLYPGLMTQRFKNLRRLPLAKRLICFPAALAGSVLALFTSYAAWNALKKGTTSYWPKAPRKRVEAHVSAFVEPMAGRIETPPLINESKIGAHGVTRRRSFQGRGLKTEY